MRATRESLEEGGQMQDQEANNVDLDDPAEQGRYGERDIPPQYRREQIANRTPEEPADDRQSER